MATLQAPALEAWLYWPTCFELGKFKRCAIEKRKQYPANASTGMKKGDGRVLHFLAQNCHG